MRSLAAKDVVVPVNRDAAKSALGSMLLFGCFDDRLTAGMFGDFADLFRLIDDLRQNNCLVADPNQLLLEAAKRELHLKVSDIVEVMEAVPHDIHFDYYVRLLIDDAKRRSLMQSLEQAYIDAADRSRDIASLAGPLDSIRKMTEPEATGRPFGAMTSKELASGKFDLTYLIYDVLVQGQPALMAGSKKVLKTGLACALNIALAMAAWWLGKFKVVRRVRSALITGESGMGTIQETARRIARSHGMELEDIEAATWAPNLPTLGDPRSEGVLRRWIESEGLEVIIIDPTYLALDVGDDGANVFKMGAKLQGLTRIVADTGVTPILCHHFKKHVEPGKVPELDWMAFAGFSEWARQWLLINRRCPFDPSGDGDHKLWLSLGGSAGHSELWGVDIHEGTRKTPGGRVWEVALVPAADAWADCTNKEGPSGQALEAKREATLQKNIDRLIEVIRKHDGHQVQKSAISGLLPAMSGRNRNAAMEAALDSGLLEPVQIVDPTKPKAAPKLWLRVTAIGLLDKSDSPKTVAGQRSFGLLDRYSPLGGASPVQKSTATSARSMGAT